MNDARQWLTRRRMEESLRAAQSPFGSLGAVAFFDLADADPAEARADGERIGMDADLVQALVDFAAVARQHGTLARVPPELVALLDRYERATQARIAETLRGLAKLSGGDPGRMRELLEVYGLATRETIDRLWPRLST